MKTPALPRAIVSAMVFSAMFMLMFMGATAHAQIIEEDEVYSDTSANNFFGRASLVSAGGGSVTQNYQALQVGYDSSFFGEAGRFYFSGLGTNSEVDLDLVLRDDIRQTELHLPPEEKRSDPERTIQIKDDGFEVRDAFIQLDLPGAFEFTGGRRRVSWGQFDLFSPINLVLPLTPQSAEPVIDKISSLVAQDQVALAWFPGERVEVHAYQFFGTRLDPLIESVINEDRSDNVVYDSAGSLIENMPENVAEDNDVTDHDQTGGRILFYPSWGVFGFSYLEGIDTLGFGSDLATVSEVPGSATDRAIYNVTSHADLPEAESFGFELAIPSGNWTWKFEYLQQESQTDLTGYSSNLLLEIMNPGTTPTPITQNVALQKYYDHIIANNANAAGEGKLFTDITRTLIAIGADAETDNWRFNLQLLGIMLDYDRQDLIDMEDAAFTDEDRSDQFAPTFNIARYIGGNKEKELGVLAGFLGTYFGASVYYTSTIGDNFRWTLGAEAFSNLRDDLAADVETGDRYELEDDISAGGRFSFIYSF